MYLVKNKKIPYERLFFTLDEAEKHCQKKNDETFQLSEIKPSTEHPVSLFEFLIDSYYVEEE